MDSVVKGAAKMTCKIGSLLVFFVCLTGSQFATAEDVNGYLSLGLGHIAVHDNNVNDPLVYKLEYRLKPLSKWQLAPSIGLARSDNNASFVFTDLARDFHLSQSSVLTPSFGFGSFDDGEDIKLGKELEFRSGIRIAYRFHNQMRLVLELFHLSNGGLSDKNPGTEPMFLSVSIPL